MWKFSIRVMRIINHLSVAAAMWPCLAYRLKQEQGRKMLKILGFKGSKSFIFPTTDGVASLWRACQHLSIWPCHPAVTQSYWVCARAGSMHFYAVNACVHFLDKYNQAREKISAHEQKWNIYMSITSFELTAGLSGVEDLSPCKYLFATQLFSGS